MSLGTSAQNFFREIDWNFQHNFNNSRIQPTESNYLFFPNAVYEDSESMVPSYYDLFPISSSISSVDQVEIFFENANYVKLTENELRKIKSLNNLNRFKVRYSVEESRKQKYLAATLPTIRVNQLGELEKLTSFSLRIVQRQPDKFIRRSYKQVATSSVLNSGKWIKVNVKETGIYKVSYSDLQAYGLSSLGNISVWGNGGRKLPYMNNVASADDLKQIPIYIEKGTDGIFNQGDYILFFAEGSLTWNYEVANDFFMHENHPYTKMISYFLTTDQPSPLRITDIQSTISSSNYQTNAYDALVAFEKNDTNLIKSGREWYGESFDLYTTRTYNTKLNNLEASGSTKIRVRVSARSSSSSTYNLSLNNQNLGDVSLSGIDVNDEEGDFFSIKQQQFTTLTPNGNLILSLTYSKPSPASNGWLDYITVNSRQLLSYQGTQLFFRDSKSIGTGKISKFSISNAPSSLQVWDVSSINSPLRITNFLLDDQAVFTLPTDTLRQFIAFEPDKALSVNYIGDVPNQNLHGLTLSDLFIITHPSFLSQANELANIHRENDGLSVSVVTTDQVYNEFSSGNRDVSSIRNFMRMLYKRSTGPNDMPKYLLLFGDGSFDNITDSKSNTNLIPTYQSSASSNHSASFVSDDYFGLLDDAEGEADGLLDIGVGRLPASTQEHANSIINKIKQYYSLSSLGDWNEQLCFIGDDEDGNIHMSDANTIADYVRANYSNYNVQKIFFDAYMQQSTPTGNRYPDVNLAINNSVNNGALIVNYTGHGNEQWLSHEKVLMLDDVRGWRNFQKLALFVTATCEFSRFDDYNLISTGEQILLTPSGGGIGLLSTTRIVYSSPNFTLNYNFFKTVFEEISKKMGFGTKQIDETHYRLGDIIKETKNISGSGYNKRNFMLLGDPAIMLKYPRKGVALTHINDSPIATFTDTIKALTKLKISGKILNPDGSDASDFNGNASLTFFDKEKNVKTLNNDGNSIVMDFKVRENIIYKGIATIKDGKFSMNCIIPKDINYKVGTGRISMYATNGTETGAGNNETLLVGGISSSPLTDNEGPTINIFLNDAKFVSGGTSNSSPKLIVQLSDSSGINTTGTGIGHDLVATIYNNTEKSIVLNDYYKAEKDSYKSGRAELQLSGLGVGQNKIMVKAWDAFNNSSSKEITFYVASDSKMKISHLLNYPNPFTENTSFYFEHNQPFTNLDILIQIYSPSGKLVKTIRQKGTAANGYRFGPIFWDGKDDFGDKIGRGVYFYKLRVSASNGKSAEQQQKLVILK